MALIKCTECGKEFSDRASACPRCNCPTEEIQKRLDRNDVITKVTKMEYLLDSVQKTGIWSENAGCSASKQLRQDLCFFTVFLGVSDNGFSRQRFDFINEVLKYNLDKNDISSIVRSAEFENGRKFYNVMLEGIASVILDACDAEDELRNRGINLNICLPDEIATLFGIVGKAFLGDDFSRKELLAYGDYMMNINMFLSKEGYMGK